MRPFRSAAVGLFNLLFLCACTNEGADAIKVQADVAVAQAQGDEKIARAQEMLERARVGVRSARVNADAVAPTTGTAPTSVDAPGTTMIAVDPTKKLVEAQFDLDKARAEQTYNVAVARCEDRTGEANRHCRELARIAYETAVNVAKSKIPTQHHRKDEL